MKNTLKTTFCLSFFAAAFLLVGAAVSRADDHEAYDPWEPMNRGTFWFNERIDLNILGPV